MTKVNLAEMVGARQVTKGNKARGLKILSMDQLRKLAMNHISEANKISLQQKKKIARKNIAELMFTTNSGKNYIKKAHPEYFNQPKPLKQTTKKAKTTKKSNNNVPAEFTRLLASEGVVNASVPLNLLSTPLKSSWASNAENNNQSNYGNKRSNNNNNDEKEQEGYANNGENQPFVYIPVRESRRKIADPRKGKAVGSMGRKVRRGMKKGGLSQGNAMNKAMDIVALGKGKGRKAAQQQRITVTVPQTRLPLMRMGGGNMRRPTVPTRGLAISKYVTSIPEPTLRRIRRETVNLNRSNNRTKMLEDEFRVQRALKAVGVLNNNLSEVLKKPTSFTMSRKPARGAIAALGRKPVGSLTAAQRKILSIMGKMKKN